MAFSSLAGGFFRGKTRRRGAEYFEDGHVDLLEGSARRAAALVLGSSDYITVLEWRGDALHTACSCPHFERDNLCKHIYATGLAAEAEGHLTAGPRHRGGVIIPDEELLAELEVEEESLEVEVEDDDEPGQASTAPEERDEVRRLPPRRRAASSPVPASGPAERWGPRPAWRLALGRVRDAFLEAPRPGAARPGSRADVVYVLNARASAQAGAAVIEICRRRDSLPGAGGQDLVPHVMARCDLAALPNPTDRAALGLLLGARDVETSYWDDSFARASASHCQVEVDVLPHLLPVLCATGRFHLRKGSDVTPLSWDEGEPYELRLRLSDEAGGKRWLLDGLLVRGSEIVEATTPPLVLRGGFFVAAGRIARFRDEATFPWLLAVRESRLEIPREAEDLLLEEIWNTPRVPPIDWPDRLRLEEVSLPPQPQLTIRPGVERRKRRPALRVELAFIYDEVLARHRSPLERLPQLSKRRLLLRDAAAEESAWRSLLEHGFRLPPHELSGAPRDGEHDLELAARLLPRVVPRLVEMGWRVEAEGKLYRKAGEIAIAVTSGIDWFDVDGCVDYDGQLARFPALLAALRRGEGMVLLDDGSFGILPEAWLRKNGLLLVAGKAADDKLRFGRSQVGLLDALLSAAPEASFDEAFEAARRELRSFDGIRPRDPRGRFEGELRPYQREGLGWLDFLERFGFGGCLADDMGLGKTVQVLALLESWRAGRKAGKARPGAALVVVPRSLVFNWKAEAARFAPNLRVLEHTGMARLKSTEHLAEYDLVLTTYGTLRRDVPFLKDTTFEYVILDEAQAVKNAGSESAKAVRLLQGRRRLALSGTPIENHLGELWSLFEFLNPGMLGAVSAFTGAAARGRGDGGADLALLAKALRPFILRRTKEDVAKDLPARSEQTIYCELEPEERKLYDDLREHYRAALLGAFEAVGLKRAKIQVLEALLRLRQAACHPGLLDRRRRRDPSAKLDLILERLAEVREEGHKALVFSQFTSFLAIVRERLDAGGVPYEYLDGRTRDRAARVKRFQADPECKIFLISLKAGGLGLNLTAAEYVFLLDPWWNPAAEAQAVDRAHRIGQTRPVFAYRLVARETVEEKVLELQEKKRELARAIISESNSLLRNLTREDLDMLFQ